MFFIEIRRFHYPRFTIKNGHVTYQNRILQSTSYKKAQQTGRSYYSEYGTSATLNDSESLNKKNDSGSTLMWAFTR